MKKLVFHLVITALLASGAVAQLTPSSDYARFKPVMGQDGYRPGESFKILFELEIAEGWHSQSHNPTMESLIPTTMIIKGYEGISFGRVSYPPGTLEKFAFTEEPLSTYKGTVYIGVTGTVAAGFEGGEYPARASLRVQICDDKVCLPPSDITSDFSIRVVGEKDEVQTLNEEIYKSAESLFAVFPAVEKKTGQLNEISDYLQSRGLLFTFLIIFIGGLALNLTPCVYPLIPVTVSYFGGQSEKKRGRLLAHALLYLLGMAAMYSALGVTAALTGDLFGALLQSWPVILFVSAVLVGLALSMFGLYDIQPPAFMAQMAGKNRKGFAGSFMMGLTVGIIAAPCIGPFVIGLLTFVGERGDPALGFSMFFVLALGLGTPFVFLALFSGAVSKLPQSGMWMVWVKKLFGFILLGMAIYFMDPLIPDTAFYIIFGLFTALAGIYLGWIFKVAGAGGGFKAVRSIVGVAALLIGAFLINTGLPSDKPGINWEKATSKAVESAAASQTPLIMDFTAEWCLPCKELDHFTFADDKVVEYSKKFSMLKADFTKSGDPDAEAMKKRFNVAGVPTVLFIGSDGKERKDLRVLGFVDADEFLLKMKKLIE